MALAHVNGLAGGGASELAFCAQRWHMLRRGRLGLQAVPLLPDLEHPPGLPPRRVLASRCSAADAAGGGCQLTRDRRL